MAKPLALTDAQYSAVIVASQPLLPQDRSRFLVALAHRLSGEAELGDGVVFRAIKKLRREYWQPPSLNEVPKHSRRAVGEPIA